MPNLAIIPARGGSKRIPGKNIRPFEGKPILGYSIEAAMNSGLFDEIMVSTDDSEIARVALSFGAKVPFLRSSENADDYATLADVLVEVIGRYEERGDIYEYVCCLLPTAPFLTSNILKDSYGKLLGGKLDSIIPILRFSYPIERALHIDKESDTIKMIQPENLRVRSQDLPCSYHDCGQFYWMRAASFKTEKNILTAHTGYIELSPNQVQDIDTEEDWLVAEYKYQALKTLRKV